MPSLFLGLTNLNSLMMDPTPILLSAPDFVPEKYVRSLSQNCVGGPELKRVRNKIQQISEETNANLKKNVYQNYMQFIDAAKEISHLESEMYQLSHLLSEQKSLLNSLSTTSVLGDETPIITEIDKNKQSEDEDEVKQKMAEILERVEGCTGILDVPGRVLLHEGDLLELDSVENTVLKTVHGYLFADGMMIASRNANSRAALRYKFEEMYELGSLAVVNVRDLGNIKHAFKLLAFPDTKVFQCSSNSSKKEWLEKFDQAKKAKLTQEQQKRESLTEKSPTRSLSLELTAFETVEEEKLVHPDWFLEVPEELDVCVAQRHFEEALTLLHKAKEYIFQHKDNQNDYVLVDIERKIDQRNINVTEVLMKELEVNPDKSLQGGLQAARRAVRLLNQLGRSTQCCDLFLKLCSSMLKTQCRRVKREGSTIMYVKHLSSVVFTNLCHMTEEFLRAFPNSSSCASAYVQWARTELRLFTNHFIKHVFVPQTSISTVTECVILVRLQCEKLCTYGIDLGYQLDGALQTAITGVLTDTRDKLIDAVKIKATEEKWIPMSLRSKSGMARCLQECNEMGLKLEEYVTGDCWLQITSNVFAFTKLFLSLLGDCLKLKTPELLYTIDEILFDVYDAQMKYVEGSVKNEKQQEQKEFVRKNAEYLLEVLLVLTQKKYTTAVGFPCPTLEKLTKQHAGLLKSISTGTRSNIHKYSSNEYL